MSVVVPVKDRRDLLSDLLRALAEQSFDDFEVIVVDDGSSDGSGDQARGARAGRGTVRVITTTGVGAVAARRAGVDAAAGSILAFTDSDCVPRREWLVAGVNAIESGADVVQGATVPARPPGPLERTVSVRREDGLYATCNVFYQRDAFERAGGFDTAAAGRLKFRPGSRSRGLGFGEDTLLGWRVRREGRSAFAPDAVVEHHVFPPSFTESLARAWMAGAFPALVREAPELRRTLLTRRVLLGTSRVPLYGVALARVLRRRTWTYSLVLWWVAGHIRRARRRGAAAPQIPAVVARSLVLDATTGLALIAGSTRTRTVVL